MLRAHYEGLLHECSQCDDVFKKSLALKNHETTHSGGGTCGVCSKVYSGTTSLLRHWKDKHQASLGLLSKWKKK